MLIEKPSNRPCPKCGHGTYARWNKTKTGKLTFRGYYCDKCKKVSK